MGKWLRRRLITALATHRDADVVDDDPRALLGEPHRDGPSDPGAAAGDERDPVLKSHG